MSGPGPSAATRLRQYAWIGVTTLALLAMALSARPGRDAFEGTALAALARIPVALDCDSRLARLAALARGEPLPSHACGVGLAEDPIARALIARIARDPRRPAEVRRSALAASLGDAPHAAGLASSFVAAPATSPAMRVAAFELLLGTPEGVVWAERARAAGPHGLSDRGLAALFALGEPETALPAREMVAALAVSGGEDGMTDVYRGLGTDAATLQDAVKRVRAGRNVPGLPAAWAPALARFDCEDGCRRLVEELLRIEARARGEEPPGRVAEVEDTLDAAYAEAAVAADHVRADLAAVAAWIGAGAAARRATRLRAAVLHPEAAAVTSAEALAEEGDPHAALRRGGGSPGATAFLAERLGVAANVPVRAWVGAGGVRLETGGRVSEVERCSAAGAASHLGAARDPGPAPASGAAPEPGAAVGDDVAAPEAGAGTAPAAGAPAGWVAVPADATGALVLVEAAAAALRRGQDAGALFRIERARALWSEAPGLAAVEAVARAAAGPIAAPASAPPTSGRRRGRSAPPPALGPAPVAVGELVGIPAGETLLVFRPTLTPKGRRGAPGPAPDTRPTERAARAELVERVLSLADEPADRVRAAWFAADRGFSEVARLLLAAAGDPGDLPPGLVPLHAAVARGLDGAPDATRSHIGRPDVVPAAVGPVPCPQPFRAEPPARAWRGAP